MTAHTFSYLTYHLSEERNVGPHIYLAFMLPLLTILLLFVKINSEYLQDSNPSNIKSSSSLLIIPHYVLIQHIDVDTHSDIVIDVQTPHFSWQLAHDYDNGGHLIRDIQKQAYNIYITAVVSGQVIWDTGYVPSSLSKHILYAGGPFTSDTHYTVTIKYYTKQHESQWYAAHFRTALFSLTD
jgi:hypothetical protein